jgi:hypothetical protein
LVKNPAPSRNGLAFCGFPMIFDRRGLNRAGEGRGCEGARRLLDVKLVAILCGKFRRVKP